MKFKEKIDQLINEGYKKSSILRQIKNLCGLKSTRAIENWLIGTSVPDVYKAQIVAKYLSKKMNREIIISDLWPIEDLSEAG